MGVKHEYGKLTNGNIIYKGVFKDNMKNGPGLELKKMNMLGKRWDADFIRKGTWENDLFIK